MTIKNENSVVANATQTINQYDSILKSAIELKFNIISSNRNEGENLIFNSITNQYELKQRQGILQDKLAENELQTKIQRFGLKSGCEISHQAVLKGFVKFEKFSELVEFYELSEKDCSSLVKILVNYYNSFESSFGDSFLRSYQYSRQQLWAIALPHLRRKALESYSAVSAEKHISNLARRDAKNSAYAEMVKNTLTISA